MAFHRLRILGQGDHVMLIVLKVKLLTLLLHVEKKCCISRVSMLAEGAIVQM
jgi:hypothetical protein